MNDVLLSYSSEGQESPTGSLGSCTILESEDDLQFLNDLGPKFKTLAEACTPPKNPTSSASLQIEVVESPPLAAQAASLTSKVAAGVTTAADLIKRIVKPYKEQSIVTKHTDVNVKTVDVSKMSVSTVLPPAIIPPSPITAINHSSNIVQASTLPCPAQTLVMQQKPVYYTSGAVLQPMQYIVQPHIQSTLLLTDGKQPDKIQGLYVVSSSQNPQSSGLVMTAPHSAPAGLVVPSTQVSPPGVLISATQGPLSGLVVPSNQGPPSGTVFQGTEGAQRPLSPNNPISPVNPTVLMPVGQLVSQRSVPVEGWKMVGPHPDSNFTLVKDRSSPVASGSAQDIFPRVVSLVKGAATPQGVISPAAQGNLFGSRHTLAKDIGIVAEGLGLEGNSHVDGLETMVTGPLQAGRGLMVTVNEEGRVAGVSRVVIGPPGKAENQFQTITQLKEVSDGVHFKKAEKKIRSLNKVRTPNSEKTPPIARTTNVPKPSDPKMFQEENKLVFNTPSHEVDERQNIFSLISGQHMVSNQNCDFGRSECEDKVRVKDPQTEERSKTSDKSPQVDTVELFQKNVLEMSTKQFVPDQQIPCCKVYSEIFRHEFTQEEEFSDVKGNLNQVDFLSEKDGDDTDESSKELIPGLIESGDKSRETEGVLTLLKTDHISPVDNQIYINSEKSVDTWEAIIFEDGAHRDDKLIHINVGEHFENRQVTDELVGPTGPAVEDLRDEGTTRPHRIQAKDYKEEQPAVTTGTHIEVTKQRSNSKVEVVAVETETQTTLELPASVELEKITAESETAQKPKFEDCREEEDLLETENVTVTFTHIQAKEDFENMDTKANSADKEVKKQCDVGEKTSEAHAENSNKVKAMFPTSVKIMEPPTKRNESSKMHYASGSKAATSEPPDVYKLEEELNSSEISKKGRQELDQEISLVETEVDSDQMESDSSDVADRENDVLVVEVSQLTFKSDENIDHKLSPQPEDNLIPDRKFNFDSEGEAAVEETVLSEVQNLVILNYKEQGTEVKQDETSILSPEDIKVPLHANVNTSDGLVEEFEREGAKAQGSPVKDQHLLKGTTVDAVVEVEVISDSISSEDEAAQEEHASLDKNVSEETDQEPINSQTMSISDNACGDHERPKGLEEDQLKLADNVSCGTNDEEEPPPIHCTTNMLENDKANTTRDTAL